MSEIKYTPGPWEFSGDGIWATSPWGARVRIATVTFFSPMNGIDAHANGRALAAAPDMLAALKHAASVLSDLEYHWHGDDFWPLISAAIAKAEGR